MVGAEFISVITNTIDTVRTSMEHYQIVKDDRNFPEAFHIAGQSLPTIEGVLEAARTQLDGRSLAEDPQSAMTLLKACNTKAKLYETMSKDVAQAPESARFERYKVAVQQYGGHMAETLVLRIMKEVCVLAEDDTIKAEMEHHVNMLHDAIDKLSRMEQFMSVEMSRNAFYASGDSHQFNVLGGTQNNNSGSGNQFTGATFSGPVNFAKNP